MSRTLHGRHANTRRGRAAAVRFYKKHRKPLLSSARMNRLEWTVRCPACQHANYSVWVTGQRTCTFCHRDFLVV